MKNNKERYSKSSLFPKEGRKNILILGNGFDIDLGLKSKYSDFIKSRNFESLRTTCQSKLITHIENCINDSSLWFDLEQSLKDYALDKFSGCNIDCDSFGDVVAKIDSDLIINDKRTFDAICENLSSYLTVEEKQFNLTEDSCAKKVLEKITSNGWYSIYSFNYTNIEVLANKVGVSLCNTTVYNIHGMCYNNSIVLGFDERADIRPQYNFLLKSFSQYYKSLNLINEMDKANDIVFFGLSFGNIDYVYFESFFKNIISITVPEEEKKTITIFTWNESSRVSILDQFRRMKINIMELFNKCHLNFIRTDFENYPDDRQLLESFLCWQNDSSSRELGHIKKENRDRLRKSLGR